MLLKNQVRTVDNCGEDEICKSYGSIQSPSTLLAGTIMAQYPPREEINDSRESDLEIAQKVIIYADTHDGIENHGL
jgi:hypothetical protein